MNVLIHGDCIPVSLGRGSSILSFVAQLANVDLLSLFIDGDLAVGPHVRLGSKKIGKISY